MEEEEPRKPKPRRPHHKSRSGCVQCKQRKIKCDELKPTCRKCEHYGTPCSYIQIRPARAVGNRANTSTSTSTSADAYASPRSQPSDSNPPPSLTATTPSFPTDTFTMLDLEILYSWTSYTGQLTLNEQAPDGTSSLMNTTFVDLAFRFPFLMHEILSLSALHLAYINPENAGRYRMASTMHHDRGLSLFQEALSCLTRENCDACYAFSTLLTIHSCSSWGSQNSTPACTDDLYHRPDPHEISTSPHIQWMKLHRGNRTMTSLIYPRLQGGPMASIFKPWQALACTDPTPLPPAEQEQLDLVAESWKSAHPPLQESVTKVLDESLKALRRMTSLATMNQDISKHSATLAWVAVVSEEYVQLVENRNPQAMVILANFCVLLKRLEYLWWCRGIADKMFAVVKDVLDADGDREDGRWERWLKWPNEQILGIKSGKVGRKME